MEGPSDKDRRGDSKYGSNGMTPKLWTFQIRGGEPFSIQPPGNPRQEHNGSMSVFHLVLTREQVNDIQQHLETTNPDCKVDAWPVAEETDDQAQERDVLLHGQEDAVFPSTACPACFWFDPLDVGYCGWTAWAEETRKQALDSHEAARDGIGNCPVH